MLRIDGIVFEPPGGFEPTETMITLTTAPAPAEGGAAGPGRARAVRPNLILQSRAARPGAELGVLAGEHMAELSQAVGGLERLTSVPFGFDDGTEGILLAYDFPVPAAGAAHASGAGAAAAPPGQRPGAGGSPKGPPEGADAGLRMRQYHVLRLDEGRLTTLTLTASADVSPAQGEAYLKALASAKRVSRPAK